MKKSVREMGKLERRQRSLSAKTLRTTVISCILLSLIALLIGLGFYSTALSGQYIGHAFDLANNVSLSLTHAVDVPVLADEVMEIYRGLSEEERQMVGTPEYRAMFSQINRESGGVYDSLLTMLASYLSVNEDVDDLYLAMYDEDTCALVYFADPEEKNHFEPGEWEHVEAAEMHKFLNWDGSGKLFDVSSTEQYGWLCTAGCPVRDETGRICAFVLSDVGVSYMMTSITDYTLQVAAVLVLFTALIALLQVKETKKTVVSPINAIADAAASYAKQKRTGAQHTDCFSSLDIRTGDELENLSLTMADMEHSLFGYEKEITKITAERERISTEMHMAARIQASMLPDTFPPYPDIREFDIYATMTPAKEVGGDFYDFFLIDNDHLCMVMADVSGKGIPGALFMMISKVIVQSCAMLGLNAAEILNKTNEALCSNNKVEMFVTVWLGILEISTGRISAANAGHEYPALYRNGGAFELLKDRHGFVIGGMPETKYEEYELQLQPGDMLFLYTDGVPEAADTDNQLFGTDRLLEALNADTDLLPRDLLGQVHNAVDTFAGEAEQFDDLTMMCLRYNGSK